MATWSDWFKAAKQQGFPLEDYLFIEQRRDLERLCSSGLPVYDSVIMPGDSDYNDKVLDFSVRHEKMWLRICNKFRGDERYSGFALEGYDGVMSFIHGLGVEMRCFDMQLFEWHENMFGGNVLSDGFSTYIEIVEGSQDIVGKSLKPFYHGYVNPLGRLCFRENVSLDMKVASRKVLDYLKKSRNEFMEGYFEFIVSDEWSVYFLDYKLNFDR